MAFKRETSGICWAVSGCKTSTKYNNTCIYTTGSSQVIHFLILPCATIIVKSKMTTCLAADWWCDCGFHYEVPLYLPDPHSSVWKGPSQSGGLVSSMEKVKLSSM